MKPLCSLATLPLQPCPVHVDGATVPAACVRVQSATARTGGFRVLVHFVELYILNTCHCPRPLPRCAPRTIKPYAVVVGL